MAETVIILLLSSLIGYLLYSFAKKKKANLLLLIVATVFIICLLPFVHYPGISKNQFNLAGEIGKLLPKDPIDVYQILFPGKPANCLKITNFQDQIVPQVDCCIWMEAKVCPSELERILSLKKFERSTFNRSDSERFLTSFKGKPSWWMPQTLGDTVTRYHLQFKENKSQTVLFGNDSSHVYICDLAL